MNILEHVGIENYLTLAALLFCIGAFGLLYRRNAIIMFMSIEIMLNAVNVEFNRNRRNISTSLLRIKLLYIFRAELASLFKTA